MLVLARSFFSFIFLIQVSLYNYAKISDHQPFKVVVYNVENLFDIDGISLYKDYQSDNYGMPELEKKLNTISKILKKIGGKSGPDILLLQEIEVDRSPENEKSATEQLLLELRQNGLGPYHYKIGYNPQAPIETWPSVHCLTLSKFPIKESKLHAIEKARPILETTLSINGHDLTLFNNHWKSGASSPEMELYRIQNAQILRRRIDQLCLEKPHADFLVAGDLNSHYNQSTVYQNLMNRTGINDILLSSSIEPAEKQNGKLLYNLWHELPPNQRGSDAWRGYWGTLMHILLPGNLYDAKGINYITDSFQVERYAGLNQIEGLEIPFSWSNELSGFGSSDHFPISALFQISNKLTKKGNNFQIIEDQQRAINYESAKKTATPWNNLKLHPKNFGKTFKFHGKVEKKKPLTINIDGYSFGLYSHDANVRKQLFSQSTGETISGYGYLSRYRGQWQFLLAKKSWLD